MNDPSISVIVPCYNYAHLLPETLGSVLAQSFEDWECIIVDDGSTDETVEVARLWCKRDERFQLVQQDNLGVSYARNNGARMARGEWLQLLDADDLIESEKLRAQYEFARNRPDVDVVLGEVRFFEGDDSGQRMLSMELGQSAFFRGDVMGKEAVLLLIESNITVINAPLIRRALWQDMEGFDITLSENEDWEFWMRCALAGAHFASAPLQENTFALVRSHPQSASKNRLKMWRSVSLLRHQWMKEDFPLSYRQLAQQLNKRCMLRDEWSLARSEVAQGEITAGWRRMRKLLLQQKNGSALIKFLALSFYILPGASSLISQIKRLMRGRVKS